MREAHDFVSGFLAGWILGGIGVAYCGFFGSGFFSPNASPVLLKKFLVPVPTFSNIDGSFLEILVMGFLVVCVLEANGLLSDQPSHIAGRTSANATSITLADKIRAILTTMISTFGCSASEETRVDRASLPGIHQNRVGSVAKMSGIV
jgi:hypothetical protein